METEQTKIRFLKMSGAGNDFILIDNRAKEYVLNWQLLAPELCNRRNGIGADGLLVIEQSDIADFKMNYFNSDGSFGSMCGNGGRCAAFFIMELIGINNVSFEAINHIYRAKSLNNNIQLQMSEPHSLILNHTISDLQADSIIYHSINTGSPHVVIFLKDITDNDSEIMDLGKNIRHHQLFKPLGTNVNFVQIFSDKSIAIRTFERGVEAETYACGTGSIASAIVYSILYAIESPIKVHTQSKEILIINFLKEGKSVKSVSLTGPARITFKGEYTTQVKHG
jgi:diaminopimelate epimerase